MSVHKAKVLEFLVVFVCGMVEGIILLKNGDLEEERRIYFLGISRVKKILFFSYSHSFLNIAVKKFIFIDEIIDTK